MTHRQFVQVQLALIVLAFLIMATFAHSVYVDVSSCNRFNANRTGQRVEASNLLNAANTVKSLTPQRRAIDRNDAAELKQPLLDCSLPVPETP